MMRRTDYGPKEAEAFRSSVLEYAVPLMKRLHQEHASILGTKTLRPWDAGYHPGFTLPGGVAPIEKQLATAQQVFDEISPRLGKHFSRMCKEGLIDLENRRGKRAGVYCTSMPDEGRVAIFCNSTGDADDVGTLMHEMGHAFQAWESQAIEAIDLQWPTSDAAEVHSMGMEYLSMPKMSRFFSQENADRFRREHLYDAIFLMCYIVIVDEFQHWVYANPEFPLTTATPRGRAFGISIFQVSISAVSNHTSMLAGMPKAISSRLRSIISTTRSPKPALCSSV